MTNRELPFKSNVPRGYACGCASPCNAFCSPYSKFDRKKELRLLKEDLVIFKVQMGVANAAEQEKFMAVSERVMENFIKKIGVVQRLNDFLFRVGYNGAEVREIKGFYGIAELEKLHFGKEVLQKNNNEK